MTDSPARRALDVAAAIRLYVDDELTVRQVGQRLGFSHTAVHDALVAAGVQLRPRGSRAKRIPAKTRAAIVAGYKAGERTAVLRARHQVSAQSIRNIVAEAGVPLRQGGCPPGGRRRRFDRDRAVLLARQGWPAGAIAVMTGFSEGHVRRELRALGYGRRPIPAGEELAMRYDRAGSIRALAAELGCSPGRVKNALERDGIRRLPKAAELVALVREVGGRAAAARLGCSLARLRAALEAAGVPVRAVPAA
ncbi:hypothetical protein [Nonomuraea candida]|uniref:hypothetical protein n=1 Tax=Nonomuraea candida TaxID=359159 RepID=UPI0012FB580D|nr:hypothetical protein [Nonomuraea candida]